MNKNLLTLALIILFTISNYAQTPTITSFSPASGPVGTLVTITGTNLSSPTAFTIGGVAAIKVSGTATTLVGMVMPGAATGSVSVTTSSGTTISSGTYRSISARIPSAQQGPKLVGTGHINGSYQGAGTALSADGNTAIVGGDADNNVVGAAWIYKRSGTSWTQQGPKLVGTGGQFFSGQGDGVALSADGNTAAVGGHGDNNSIGATWIFTRSGNTWTQQGNKLVGTGASGPASQGGSVSISADGNTLITGGSGDSSNRGAAWIFVRTGSTWTQQGPKLVANSTSYARQGQAVSISADGNTAIIGGWSDSSDIGAAWVFTRTGGVWTQQGSKLIGTGASQARQGFAVSLSADGNTAIIGGNRDSSYFGAQWIFTRTGSSWAQHGPKLVGAGSVGSAVYQGQSVSISADGTTAIGGGYNDDNSIGAAWIFAPVPCSVQGASLTDTICAGGVYSFHGRNISIAGVYYDTLTASGGCDSVITLTLSVYPLSGHALSTSICAGSSYFFHSQNLTSGGIYHDTLTSVTGCDSVITLTLSVDPPSGSSISYRICPGGSYLFHHQNLTSAGTYRDTLTNSRGCDSIVTLTLSVSNTSQSSFSHSICSGSSYSFGGHVLTTAGTYHDTLTNSGGCDSIVTLTLAVNPLPSQPHITRNGTTLSVTATGHLLWFYNGLPQAGDTINSITISQNGSYTLQVTDANGCSRFSDTMLVAHLNITDILSEGLRVYPNPASESFTIRSEAGTSYTFSDMTGRVIHSHVIEKENTIVSLDGLSSGIYILQIEGQSYKVVKE